MREYPLLFIPLLGDQGSEHDAFGAQPIHQVGFVRPAESGLVDETNLAFVFGTLRTEKYVVAGAHRQEFNLLRSQLAKASTP
jgi:hypothetical protein